MLVPAVAWLTRSALTAEPAAARACAAAAGGTYRAHLAALTTALARGLVLALAGAAYELIVCEAPAGGVTARVTLVAGGLGTAAICDAVGSAISFCNPPVVRRLAVAIMSTTAAVIVSLVAGVSPANAALREAGSKPHAPTSVTGLPLIVALVLLTAAWTVSALLAARRG